jgi:hypothetical protein
LLIQGSFRLPLTDLATAPNQKYQSVTLAVVQRVDLNSNPAVQQKAQPFLGLADPFRQIDFTTGSNPRQQKVYSLTRTDLATVSGVGDQLPAAVSAYFTSGSPRQYRLADRVDRGDGESVVRLLPLSASARSASARSFRSPPPFVSSLHSSAFLFHCWAFCGHIRPANWLDLGSGKALSCDLGLG